MAEYDANEQSDLQELEGGIEQNISDSTSAAKDIYKAQKRFRDNHHSNADEAEDAEPARHRKESEKPPNQNNSNQKKPPSRKAKPKNQQKKSLKDKKSAEASAAKKSSSKLAQKKSKKSAEKSEEAAKKGLGQQLTIKLNGASKCEWSESNPFVVKMLSKGNDYYTIKGAKKGVTNIVATLPNGQSCKMKITVEK